jgi:hypothetical protein
MTRVGFTGDVMLGRTVDDHQRRRPPERVCGDVLDHLRDLDGLLVDLERTHGPEPRAAERPRGPARATPVGDRLRGDRPAVREQRTEAAASLIEGDATIVRRSIEQLLL